MIASARITSVAVALVVSIGISPGVASSQILTSGDTVKSMSSDTTPPETAPASPTPAAPAAKTSFPSISALTRKKAATAGRQGCPPGAVGCDGPPNATASNIPASLAPDTRTDWKPIIDPRGVDQARYHRDLTECSNFARANPETDRKAKAKKRALQGGVGAGALMVGATIATGGLALLPMLAGGTAFYAGASALGGASLGQAEADAKYQSMVVACLAGRGYSIIG